MSIKLTDIGSGYNISKINSNFENLETYINSNVLHRANSNVAGEAMMQRDLDMNGHTILNAELDGSSITNDRAVRVPVGEGSIPPLPGADERKGKILTFDVNTGYPITIAPVSGSAVDVLNQLAGENGGSLVGYRNPASAKLETVKDALDKLNLRIIYAADFGVKVDGSDNAAALFALGQEISTATTPVHVIFPKGTSLVGSQKFAGATGQGYSYLPTYFDFPWGDASDRGWFSVHRTNNQITLDMTGWTLKMNDGMKLGSFNPTTGAAYTPPSLPFYSYDYQASQGFLIKIYKAPNVKIIGGTTDGNLANAVWGGNFGDTGYQVPAYNLWLNQSSGMLMEDHIAQNSPLDGLYIGETDAVSPTVGNQVKGSKFRRLLIQDCGRNCISYTGGGNATFEDIEVWRAGNNATGITGHGSGPASCLDVESEGGNIFNLKFIRCKFMYGDQYGVVGGFPVPNDITDVFFIECTIHSEAGNYAFVNYARNVNVIDSVIYGAVSLDTTTRQEPTAITGTKFYNRIDGRYITNFSISGITNKFNDNTVSIEIPTTPLPASPIFNLSGFQPLPGGYGNRARVSNLLVLISGNSNNISHTDLGSFAYYADVTCHVDAAGLTGSKNLGLNLQNCSLGYEGAVASGSALINFGGSMQNQTGTSIYFDNSRPVRAGGVISPYLPAAVRVGSRANAFTHGWFNDGILTKSPDGTTYRLRVNNGGAVVAIIDNSTP